MEEREAAKANMQSRYRENSFVNQPQKIHTTIAAIAANRKKAVLFSLGSTGYSGRVR
jgi:hypothetical protein